MNPAITFTITALVITVTLSVIVGVYDWLAAKYGWETNQ